jgi:hypothetical protein
MVVSKKTLSVIRGGPIEGEPRGQGPPQPPQSIEGVFSSAITADFELPRSGNPDLDLISVLKLQRLNDGGGKADS